MKRLPGYRKFRKWLKSKDPDAVVGITSEPYDCPIYHWMSEEGVNVTRVERTRVGLFGRRGQTHPRWRYLFISTVDSNYKRVTAREALKVLNKVAH